MILMLGPKLQFHKQKHGEDEEVQLQLDTAAASDAMHHET
jgi:hypothetical protein